MKILKYLSQAVQLVLMLSSLSIGALYVAGQFGIIPPLSAFIILSGSMKPAIGVGSISIVQAQQRYSPGDIITYSKTGKNKMTVTHRVTEVIESSTYYGDPEYVTKGDANEEADSGIVKHANVAGRVIVSLPYLGYIADFAKTPKGFVLLIIVPATIIIYEELKNLKKQFAQMLRSVADSLEARRAEQTQDTVIQNAERSSFPKIAILIPVITLPAIFMATAHAIYADTEISSSNVFVASSEFNSENFPTPTPTTTATPTPTPSTLIEIKDNGQDSENTVISTSSESAIFEQENTVDVEVSVHATSDTGRDAIKNNIGF